MGFLRSIGKGLAGVGLVGILFAADAKSLQASPIRIEAHTTVSAPGVDVLPGGGDPGIQRRFEWDIKNVTPGNDVNDSLKQYNVSVDLTNFNPIFTPSGWAYGLGVPTSIESDNDSYNIQPGGTLSFTGYIDEDLLPGMPATASIYAIANSGEKSNKVDIIVPEPATLGLLGVGAGLVAGLRRKRR